MTEPGTETERYRQQRRTAARSVLLVLVVGIGVQLGAWAIASGHPNAQAAVILAVTVVVVVAVGVLLPIPPGGFLWPWQRAARARNAEARPRGTAYDGFDLLWLVTVLTGVLPWQVFSTWLQNQDDPDMTTELVMVLVVALSSIGLLYGVLEVRRHRGLAAAGAGAGEPRRAAGPPAPGLVTLHRRPDREHR